VTSGPSGKCSPRRMRATAPTSSGELAKRRIAQRPLLRPKSAAMTDDVLRVATLTVPCLLGLWTAVACRRAQYHGLPGSDALVWAGLSGAFFLLSLMKTARGLGYLRGFGGFLRDIFKQRGWYEDRRSLQIGASIAVSVVVMALLVWGLLWTWHRIKRYRLAIGFAGLTVGFGIIRACTGAAPPSRGRPSHSATFSALRRCPGRRCGVVLGFPEPPFAGAGDEWKYRAPRAPPFAGAGGEWKYRAHA
jgi:hypothetical protein